MNVELLNEIGEYFLAGHIGCNEEKPIIKYASGLYNLYKRVPISIEGDYELAPVRNLFGGSYCFILCNGLVPLSDGMAEDKKEKYNDPRIKEVIDKSKEYWSTYSVNNILHSTFNDEDRAVFAANDGGKYESFFSDWQGHATLDYKRILEKGFMDYRSRIDEKLCSLDSNADDYEKKNDFYRSLVIVMDGIELLIQRHIDLCQESISQGKTSDSDAPKINRLLETFQQMLTGAPESFYQAIEYVHFFNVIDGFDNAGRIDQYLYPFYKKDVESGKTDDKMVEELFFQLFDMWGNHGYWNRFPAFCFLHGRCGRRCVENG